MNELKPCMFCGHIDTYDSYIPTDGNKWGARFCGCCGATGPEVQTNYIFDSRQDWMDDADKEWNRRIIGIWLDIKTNKPKYHRRSYYVCKINAITGLRVVWIDMYHQQSWISDQVTHFMPIPLPHEPKE